MRFGKEAPYLTPEATRRRKTSVYLRPLRVDLGEDTANRREGRRPNFVKPGEPTTRSEQAARESMRKLRSGQTPARRPDTDGMSNLRIALSEEPPTAGGVGEDREQEDP